MPPKRRILVLINPFSGAGIAARNWVLAEVILSKAYIDMTVIRTERAKHAYDIVQKEIKPGDYEGIVTVSGDGLIHEVVNGIFRRDDWLQLLSKMTLGFIPGGTSNGLIKSLLDHAGESFSVENAAFAISKGRQMKMDLIEITGEYEKEKIYCFLAIAWAVIADIDINSEVLRWMGFMRMTMWGVYRTLFRKLYRGYIWYRGMKLKNRDDVAQLKGLNEYQENQLFTPELPEPNEQITDHLSIENQYNDAVFQYVMIQNCPFLAMSLNNCPLSQVNDGMNDIVIQTVQGGRYQLAKILIDQDNGGYFEENGNLKNGLSVEYIKCTSWRINPFAKCAPPVREEQQEEQKGHLSRTSRDVERMNSNTSTLFKNEEVKKSKSPRPTSSDQQDPLLSKGSNATLRPYKDQLEHVIDDRAFYSIDGERYDAQMIQGKVLKEALPVYY